MTKPRLDCERALFVNRRTQPQTGHFARAVLLSLLCASGCAFRTELLTPVVADAAAISDGKRPSDGAAEALADGPAVLPDVLPSRPDLPNDKTPDVPPNIRPDSPPDLPRSPDLPTDYSSDLSSDPMPDRLVDGFPDLPVDRFPDLRLDLGPETIPDGQSDLPPDLLPDAGCSGGETVPCVCDNGLSGHRICLPSHAFSECGCGTPGLMRVRDGVIGTWTGTATTPWLAPYRVTFTFDSYSHYSARRLEGDTPALYYGIDADSPSKQYAITNIQANGNATGYLDVYFGPSSITRNTLQEIILSPDGNRLQFWFMQAGAYGPLQYDLLRSAN